MKKLLIIATAALFVSNPTFAGGIITNTNQNATFLRMPARGASIAIDGVYSNPAGTAFLPQGLHFSLSWQAAIQERKIESSNMLFSYNANNNSQERVFKGKTIAPVVPSLQAAYVINDKWSISGQFAVNGGGGKCDYENGLPMFEKLVGGKLIDAKADSYSLQQNLIGEQYFYSLQVGGTYKLTNNFSLFGGLRGILANCSYNGNITNIKANGIKGSDYLTGVKAQVDAGIQQLEPVKDLPEYSATYNELVSSSAALGQGIALMSQDFVLDCSQKDFGITPIIGLNWNLGKLNIGAKYEFRTKINLENDSKNSSQNVIALMPDYKHKGKVRSDIPAFLSVAAQYKILPTLRAAVEYHFFDDKAAYVGTDINKNKYLTKGTNEYLFGIEWDVTKRITLSGGAQRTDFGLSDAYQSETSFQCDSYSLGIGAEIKMNDKLKLNLGYLKTNYYDYKVVTPNFNGVAGLTDTNIYSRNSNAFGVSLNYSL